jgi:hypothetical protein
MGPSPEPSERPAALYDDEAFEGPRRTSARLLEAEGPMAPRISPSGEGGEALISGSPERVSDTVPRVGEAASEYAAPPDMVVDAFLPVEPPSVVVPQPR